MLRRGIDASCCWELVRLCLGGGVGVVLLGGLTDFGLRLRLLRRRRRGIIFYACVLLKLHKFLQTQT